MAKGNYCAKYYICANMNYDLGIYDGEFRANNVDSILYGSRFFADLMHLRAPRIPGAIVEIHGLGPGTVNVGIYIDVLEDLPADIQLCLLFEHQGNKYYEEISWPA